jgi:5-methylcytosine-specific restriction endonuclease McrA
MSPNTRSPPQAPAVRSENRVLFVGMSRFSQLSDAEILASLHGASAAERRATAELLARLAEVERRRLYLTEACSSLYAFCVQRLGYSENEAQKRIQVARPTPGDVTPPLPVAPAKHRLEPLSASSYRIEFTAGTTLHEKLEQARNLLTHNVPSGDLAQLFERALEALLETETRRRMGAAKPRRQRALKPGSRHVPVEVARAVWERDDSQCTFIDAQGRRCAERRFLELEHRTPFARGGQASADNLCLLCKPHNALRAREEFGEAYIEARRLEAQTHEKTLSALVNQRNCWSARASLVSVIFGSKRSTWTT